MYIIICIIYVCIICVLISVVSKFNYFHSVFFVDSIVIDIHSHFRTVFGMRLLYVMLFLDILMISNLFPLLRIRLLTL